MAETVTVTASPAGGDVAKINGTATERPPPPRQPLNQIYALPAPIRTFPLPAFYPNNPISLLHLAYAWLTEVFRPPPPEPSVIHVGVWDPETRSVHVRDAASIRALWEQGFYGKGSLSRSEPNWLKRELARRGSPEGKTVSEARTELRREERRLAKWERAKTELEAIEKQRLAEATARAAVAEPSESNGVVKELPDAQETQSLLETGESSTAEALTTNGVAEDVVAVPSPEMETPPAISRVVTGHKAPVGPAELLALPNTLADLLAPETERRPELKPPVGPAELLLLPNSVTDLYSRAVMRHGVPTTAQPSFEQPTQQTLAKTNGHAEAEAVNDGPHINGGADLNGTPVKASAFACNGELDKAAGQETHLNGTANGAISPRSPPSSDDYVTSSKEPRTSKRRKSVRFSPTVESATFLHSDPPSPIRSPDASSKTTVSALPNAEPLAEPLLASVPTGGETVLETASDLNLDASASSTEIENKEHFQLAPEEAFFLVFGLGALQVVEPVTGSPISTEHLLSVLRSYSYFPPRPLSSGLRPDDAFLVNYAVYHHFRSLGWVPRHGIKFGVDWILYQRGPVFDHSEFGLMIMPSYSSALWEGEEHEEPKRSWSWLMGVNRVLSHVLKSLVLVYVDIPPPSVFDEEMRRGGIAAALKKYVIREVMVRRFSVNRNR